MIVFLVFFFIFLYIFIGAAVTYYLHYLYSNKACYKPKDTYDSISTPSYCVMIGIFWLFAAPFAFALYYSRYGFPQSKEKR